MEDEMEYVMKAVMLRLTELWIAEEITEEAEALFRVLWRFERHRLART